MGIRELSVELRAEWKEATLKCNVDGKLRELTTWVLGLDACAVYDIFSKVESMNLSITSYFILIERFIKNGDNMVCLHEVNTHLNPSI